jgi:hypothetical protein
MFIFGLFSSRVTSSGAGTVPPREFMEAYRDQSALRRSRNQGTSPGTGGVGIFFGSVARLFKTEL